MSSQTPADRRADGEGAKRLSESPAHGSKVTIDPLEQLSKKDAAALEADAARVLEFFGAGF